MRLLTALGSQTKPAAAASLGIRGSIAKTNTTNLTVSVARADTWTGSLPAAGDVLVAVCAHHVGAQTDTGILGAPSFSVGSGWSAIGASGPSSDLAAARGISVFAVWTRTATGNTSDDFTYTDYAGSGSLTNPGMVVHVIAVSGTTGLRNTTDTGGAFTGGATAAVTTNNATGSTTGDLIINHFIRIKHISESITWSAISGTVTQIQSTDLTNSTDGVAVLTNYEILGTAGTRTATGSSTNTNDRNATRQWAFKP